jgi:hypothetical protein
LSVPTPFTVSSPPAIATSAAATEVINDACELIFFKFLKRFMKD